MKEFKTNFYADDMAVTISERDPKILETQLNEALKIIMNWFNGNKLSLNRKKSKIMFFGTHGQLLRLNNVMARLLLYQFSKKRATVLLT